MEAEFGKYKLTEKSQNASEMVLVKLAFPSRIECSKLIDLTGR